MKTHLTKDMRATIIDNVVRATDIPDLTNDLKQRVKQRAREFVTSQIPEDFTLTTKRTPKQYLGSITSLGVGDRLSPMPLLDDEINPGHWSYIRLDDPVPAPVNLSVMVDSKRFPDTFTDLYKEAEQLIERRDKLRGELRAYLQSHKTVESLLAAMPELEPHAPSAVKPMPLVAPSNLLSSLVGLGFDRTAKQA